MTVVTTTDLKQPYEIIDTLFAVDSHKEGFLKELDPNKAFEGVKNQLRNKCEQIGGQAVICCQFEYRVATSAGFTGTKQVLEIFAYGTAVKLNP